MYSRLSVFRARSFVRFNSTKTTTTTTTSSAWGSLTKDIAAPVEATNQSNEKEPEVTPENDVELQKFLNPQPIINQDTLISPLKQQLFKLNVAKNGFFKNNDTVTLEGKPYQLKLSREVIEALEPSIFLRSWRIKSSVKKTNPVLRALKNLPLKKAITQTQFMEKKISRDITEMLQRGIEDAQRMGYKSDNLYLDQSWVHTDGQWGKRIDWKGRGRMGMIKHRYVSIRILLKSTQTQKRLAWEQKQRDLNKKVLNKIADGKIKGSIPGFYRW
ncbi:mitochondrial 54S ribosomal protein YmL22 [Martiniozyma asiatica (nom. inval.)]|nr:mitochondrial 54S ribosomal protein YmL22 [Martiniozyma asiatica]